MVDGPSVYDAGSLLISTGALVVAWRQYRLSLRSARPQIQVSFSEVDGHPQWRRLHLQVENLATVAFEVKSISVPLWSKARIADPKGVIEPANPYGDEKPDPTKAKVARRAEIIRLVRPREFSNAVVYVIGRVDRVNVEIQGCDSSRSQVFKLPA